MDLIDRNLNFIEKSYPQLLPVIQGSNGNCYKSDLTKRQEPNIILNKDESEVCLHSKYNAEEEARKWVLSLNEQDIESEHLLIVGCGLGYFLEQLLYHSKSSYIYIYEPNIHILKEWVQSRDVTRALSNPRVRLFVVGEDELFHSVLASSISSYIFNTFGLVSPPVYKRLYPNLVSDLQLKIRDALNANRTNQATLSVFNKQWLENVLFNLPYINKDNSAKKLKEFAKGSTAIIVGSGPSLKYDIEYLRAVKSKCLIIAAGSSIQALEHYGVTPHMVVSMDGGIPNYKVFENIDTGKVPLVFCSQINYHIVENYKAPVFSSVLEADGLTPYIVGKESLPKFQSTTSVTGTAMQLAVYMGASEIVLTGQDLSYPENQFYTLGVNHLTSSIINNELSKAKELVPNVDGGENLTTLKMKVTLNDLGLLVQFIVLQDVRVINSSKHGAVISGTEWRPMEELLPQWLDKEDRDFTIDKFALPLQLEDKLENFSSIKNDIQSLYIKAREQSKRITRMMDIIQQLADKLVNGNISTLSKKLIEVNKLWTTITEQDVFKVIYSFLLKQHIDTYMRYVTEIVETQDQRKKAKLIVEHLGKLVKVMNDLTPDLLETLNIGINRIDLLIDGLGDVSYERTI
ncbi:motility associated factor glycosyltransferase family protein [Paenibacillus sp. GM2]|uniref:motility associated factor glycosyltransferase family protein n=1 Tax=Paenibacillus sp. GM2 TaxID=1622070 RepID=UPI0008394332|nr:6-hydroxymethylpterin diphosphokinase MptE-like protein [Paenibacillus sp. GM2]